MGGIVGTVFEGVSGITVVVVVDVLPIPSVFSGVLSLDMVTVQFLQATGRLI